jgi:hypothetical protein
MAGVRRTCRDVAASCSRAIPKYFAEWLRHSPFAPGLVTRFDAAIASGDETAIKRHAFWSSRLRGWALMSPSGGALYCPAAIDRFGNFVQAAKRDSGMAAQ